MRTLAANEEQGWRTGLQSSHARVTIGGVDMRELHGMDWLHSLSITESVEDQVAQATVKLHREFEQLSLATFRDDSLLNQGGTIVDLAKSITIEVAVLPPDVPPEEADWMLRFSGFIDTDNWSKSPIELKCRDKGGELQDNFIEVQRVYGSVSGTDLEEVIQNILDDNSTGVTLYSITGTGGTPFTPGDSPGFLLREFYQSKTSVMEAIRNLATMIGWECKYRFNPNTSDYELTLFEPDRAKTTPDFTFSDRSEYDNFTQLTVSRLDVRNAIKGVYTDRGALSVTGSFTYNENGASPDTITRTTGSFITDGLLGNQKIDVLGTTNNDGQYQIDTVAALTITLKDFEDLTTEGPISSTLSTGLRTTILREDSASIAKYGRRYMEMTEASSSQIDEITEMESMLDAAKSDLAEPTAIAGVALPFFPWAELEPGDLWQFDPNDVHFDTAQKLAPQTLTQALEAGGAAKTTATLRGKISGGRLRWLNREGGRFAAAAIDDKSDEAAANLVTTPHVGTIIIEYDDPRTMSPPIPDWAFTDCHVSTTSGFTPTEANRAARGKTTRFDIGGLIPGESYYVKLLIYDELLNIATISAQVQLATEKVGPFHTNNESEFGVAINPNPNFGIMTKDPTTTPFDFWDVNVPSFTDWGTADGEWYFSTAQSMTGGRSLLFQGFATPAGGSFATEFRSDFCHVEEGRLYVFAFAARRDGSGSTTSLPTPVPHVEWYTKAQALISSGNVAQTRLGWETPPILVANFPANTWIADRGWAIAPANAAYLRVIARVEITVGTATSDKVFIDHLIVNRSLAKLIAKPGTGSDRTISTMTWTQPFLAASTDLDNASAFTEGLPSPVTEHKYTIPVDGEYVVFGRVATTTALASSKSIIAKIQKNAVDLEVGAASAGFGATAAQPTGIVAIDSVQLLTGDEITLWAWQNSGTRTLDDSECALRITQLSNTTVA